ncbi:MAG TPA: ATP-binding protein [Vicinamibacteria bacterium]|nr:ATP-binding protein [Vicinamibacteria bacterium]
MPSAPSPHRTIRAQLAVGLAAGLAGFALNSAPLPLLPGIDLIFGSALTLAIAARFGPVAGGLGGLLAGARTYWLWSQPIPWSALLLGLEGVWVGRFSAPPRRHRLLYSGLAYWVLVGGWLNALGQHAFFQLPWPLAWAIGLRSTVNGLFCALLAEALLMGLAFVRRRAPSPQAFRLSLSAAIGLTLMLAISVPTTVAVVVFARRAHREKIERAVRENTLTANALGNALQSRLTTLGRAVSLTAELIEAEGVELGEQERLNRLLAATRQQYPEFQGMYVADARARTVAFSPPRNAAGEPLVGLDYSDRSYYRELLATRRTVYSGVYQARGGMTTPTAAIAAPLHGPQGELTGFVLGWFRLESFQSLVVAHGAATPGHRVVITDAQGNLVADSSQKTEDYRVVTSLVDDPAFAQGRASAQGTALLTSDRPQPKSKAGAVAVEKWWLAWSTVPEGGWKVLVCASTLPVDEAVATLYAKTVSGVLGLLFLATLITHVLGGRIARPLVALEKSARRLAGGDLSARPEVAPVPILEAHALTQAFTQMAGDLERSWREQRVLTDRATSAAQEAEEQAKRLAAVNALATELATTFDLTSLCRTVMRYAEVEVRATAVSISLTPEPGGRLVPIYDWAHGVENDAATLSFENTGSRARSLREKRPLLVQEGDATTVHLPLVAFEQVVGLLTVRRDQPPLLDQATLTHLAPIGAQVALSVSNARLFEQVARGKAEWEATFDGMSDAVFVFGPERRVIRANHAAATLEGVPVGSLVGRRSSTLTSLSSDGPDLVAEAIEHGRRQVRELASGERMLLVTVEPVRAPGGAAGAVAVARDVTDVRRAEEQAQRAGKLAAVGQLAAGVAHDFNNILAAILGRAQLLKRRVTGPDAQSGLEVIEKAALDGASTVRRLQNFAGRKSDEAFAPVRLDDLARDTVELLKTRWRDDALAKGLTYNVVLDLEPASVLGSAPELREVLANLAINALDAMPGGGRLCLRCRAEGQEVRLSVEDSGSGMSEQVQRHIFEPFYTTKGHAGTGLGLAVSYGIVQRHRGAIEVDSEPGRGTVFTVSLPRSEPDQTAALAPAPLARRRLRSLVIDDEDMVRDTLLAMLEELGHETAGAASGPEGLAILERERFDLVFTDLSMPEMDGLTVAREVRRRNRGVKILLVTGYGAALELDPTASEVDAVVNKPFAFEQVSAALEQVLPAEADPG